MSVLGVEAFFIVLLLIGAAVIAVIIVQARLREAARLAYEEGLERLRHEPTNPYLRTETLRLGRAYSRRTRNRFGVTLFDEVALSNDISAACAAHAQPKSARESIETRLANLAALKARGLIDESEFAARRLEILREV